MRQNNFWTKGDEKETRKNKANKQQKGAPSALGSGKYPARRTKKESEAKEVE